MDFGLSDEQRMITEVTRAFVDAELTPHVSPFNEALTLPSVRGTLDLADPQSLAAIEAEIARQATMLGYLDTFWAFSATALVVLPLIALVRWKRAQAK